MSETQTTQSPTTSKSAPTPDVPRARSADDLKKGAIHSDFTLPSGQSVTIRVPNLTQMVKSGTLPNDLIDAALQQEKAPEEMKPDEKRELMEATWDFVEFIVPVVLVEPKIEASDVKDLDANDVELLAAVATRRTDMDAVGHQLGGLETLKSFRDARGIISLSEALGDES